jgi:hypothetical protein
MSLLLEKLEEMKSVPPNERMHSSARQHYLHERLEREERLTLSRQIRGKYADLIPSSDAFAALKAEEIALEERRGGA